MSETKTVELPLTKSERRHLANIERRDAKRERAAERRAAQHDRDEQLQQIQAKYAPKIARLQAQAADERVKVWAEWRKRRDAQ